MKSGQSIGLFTQREEVHIDFRVSGLPHAVVKQKENFRVRELVKKIESHPHREALQADLQQNNVYNPFSDDSKASIRETGNVDFFELCETIPKVERVIYCTCGHLLVESESSHKFHQWRLDALSIPHYVLGMRWLRGARHRKIEAPKDRFVCHNARKRRIKNNFDGIHDRFQRDPENRDSQLKLGGPRGSALQWKNWHRKTTLAERYRKLVYLTEQIGQGCTDQTSEQQSQQWTASPRIWRRTTCTNSFSSIPKMAFVFFFWLFIVAVGKIGVFFFICCSKIVYRWVQSAATDEGVWTERLDTSHFLVFVCTRDNVSHDIGSRC